MKAAVLCCELCAVSPGHVAVEKYLESEGLPFTVFQPLYIYGPHTAKDCEQWFVDRIIRWVTRHSSDQALDMQSTTAVVFVCDALLLIMQRTSSASATATQQAIQ